VLILNNLAQAGLAGREKQRNLQWALGLENSSAGHKKTAEMLPPSKGNYTFIC
jgi:hypothetical protein